MGPDWRSILKEDPVEWLLDPSNPSIRYHTLQDLLDYSENDPVVEAAKASIKMDKKVGRIFSKQKNGGYWEDPDTPYKPKYKASYWQIMILGMLGLDNRDRGVDKACDYIFQFQHEEGGFSQYKEKGALEEYEWIKKRALRRGKEVLPFQSWAEEKIWEMQLSCLTGNVALALIRLGYSDDVRVERALNWLVKIQNEDGGWLCPHWRARRNDKHSCFMGTITPLDAFSELPVKLRTPLRLREPSNEEWSFY